MACIAVAAGQIFIIACTCGLQVAAENSGRSQRKTASTAGTGSVSKELPTEVFEAPKPFSNTAHHSNIIASLRISLVQLNNLSSCTKCACVSKAAVICIVGGRDPACTKEMRSVFACSYSQHLDNQGLAFRFRGLGDIRYLHICIHIPLLGVLIE